MTRKKATPRMFSSMGSCSSVVGVDIEILKTAKAAGCPGFDANGRVRWDLAEKWLAENADDLPGGGKESLGHWKLEKCKWDAKASQIKYQKSAGEVLDLAEAESWYESCALALATKLYDKLETELPARFHGRGVAECSVIGRAAADELLNEFRQFKTKQREEPEA